MKFPVMRIEEPGREKEKKVHMLHTVDIQKNLLLPQVKRHVV
jgi:hypothetical protein